MQTICVIGLGYIGLPTSLIFARNGYQVIGCDINPDIVTSLQQGETQIQEAGLLQALQEALHQKTFTVQGRPDQADVFMITVPTPIMPDQTADLSYVQSAVDAIMPYLQPHNLIIIESTIPPRTTTDIIAPKLQQAGWQIGENMYLAHCPERVLPGSIMTEIVKNDRIIGGYDKRSTDKAAELYRAFVEGDLHLTTATTAETAKLMENTYRDVNIALVNELAKISADIQVDTLEVIRLANKHPRVHLHAPGPGVGGHCIAVDPYFIIEKSPMNAVLMQSARLVNRSMPQFIVEQVEKILMGKRKVVTIFGIAYKGNVDDVRESPALEIIERLTEMAYEVKIHDPYVMQDKVKHLQLLDAPVALEGSHCLLVLSDHKPFRTLDENLLITKMASPIILDTKQIVTPPMNKQIRLFHFGNLYEVDTRISENSVQ